MFPALPGTPAHFRCGCAVTGIARHSCQFRRDSLPLCRGADARAPVSCDQALIRASQSRIRQRTMQHSTFPPGIAAPCTDEQIDVMRIRLWTSSSASALLGEFYSADRVLARWGSEPACSPVGFEVTFHDGYVVRGSHEFFRKGKRRCLLATHVRRMLERAARQADAGFPVPKPDLARYVIPV